MAIPRIRGRIGVGEDKKFYTELSLWNLGGTQQVGDVFTFGPFETEAEAKENLQRVTQAACEAIEESHGQKPSGQYLDLKVGGVMKPWTVH